MDDDLNYLESQIEKLIESRRELMQEIESLQLQLVKLNEELMKTTQEKTLLADQNQQASLQIQRIISQLKEEINAT